MSSGKVPTLIEAELLRLNNFIGTLNLKTLYLTHCSKISIPCNIQFNYLFCTMFALYDINLRFTPISEQAAD